MSALPSSVVLRLVEAGWFPDAVLRQGIRKLCAARLREQNALANSGTDDRVTFARERSSGPIAIDTAAANEQHYEVPTEFYRQILGKHLKYSCAWWDDTTTTLDEAEERMLALYVSRAGITGGQRVLELGCGWGSLSLWLASRFPTSDIVGVSNSATQKEWIDAEAARRGLANLEIITADMNTFDAPGQFDRIVSIEMFEHMRNWRALLTNVVRWLRDDGELFIHIFTHRRHAYSYDVRDASDWMAAYFFSGGIMPSDDLIYQFADLLTVLDHWRVNGTHYEKTANAWLANMDAHAREIMPLLVATYGQRDAERWRRRWRLFFMACAELWGYNDGREWIVSQYRVKKARG